MIGGGTRRTAAVATLVGTGGTVLITVAQAFFLIPLCLAYLGVPLYGSWLAASEVLLWLQLFDFGIPNLLTQRIGAAMGRDARHEAAQWASSGLLILFAIAAVLTLIAFVAAPVITNWASVAEVDAEAFTASFRLGGVASALLLVSNGAIGISRGVQITALLNSFQIAGATAGFLLTLALLIAGFGIWALPLGLLGRGLIAITGSMLFLLWERRRIGLALRRPSREIFRETGLLMPAMAAGSAGYIVANNTEIVLVTTIFGPVTAVVYALTRRAMDAVRNLVDSFAWAAYGPFAHLVTASDRHRARPVLEEILWIRLSIACFAAAIVIAVNRPFVTLLFGRQNFGGTLLTLAFAGQMVIGGQAFLANYLLRAAGWVREGSFVLALEAIVRLGVMGTGLWVAGLAGGPLAAMLSSGVGLVIMRRWLDRDLPPGRADRMPAGPAGPLFPIAVVFVGLLVALLELKTSWLVLLARASVVTIAGGTLLWFLMPREIATGSILRWGGRDS